MSYTPTNWKTGDVVTSSKLNKLENGVADAGGGGWLAVEATYSESDQVYTCTKKAGEIFAARPNVYIYCDDASIMEVFYVTKYILDGSEYQFYTTDQKVLFTAPTEDDYPTTDSDPK